MVIAPEIQEQSIDRRVSLFYLCRLLLIFSVLVSTIFLKQEVLGVTAIVQMYAVLLFTFFLSLMHVSFWEKTLQVRYFMPYLLLNDILLTSYLVYLTGVDNSIFLFLYLLNIVFASVVYQLPGALAVALLSGLSFFFIYYANNDMDQMQSWYTLMWHELFFLLTALLSGQFMDEQKKQKALVVKQRANIERLEILNDKLLNSIPLGLLLVDENEYVQKINQTAMATLKIPRVPNKKIKYFDLIPELKGILGAWDQMSEVQRLRYLFSTKENPVPHLSLQLVRLTGKTENARQHIMTFQDVSKTIELEQRLEFESKLAATGELAAGIAHEIRNPLASISGSIELLAHNLPLDNPQDRKLMDIASLEIRRLNHLVTDFLEFAKPKDNTSNNFPLYGLIEEVAAALQSRAGAKKISVKNNLAPALIVHANRERMTQVFFNLFLNSLEAAPSQEITIEVSAEPKPDAMLAVHVHDDGPGIPASSAAKIFDPFFTTKANGTGLGLPTVAQIMRAAKGQVLLEPSSRGAHFVLLLPASSKMEMAHTAS